MKNIVTIVIIVIITAIAIVLLGCTSAGPYVTSISNNGNHGLTVEKCATNMNAFMGTVSSADCTQSTVSIK